MTRGLAVRVRFLNMLALSWSLGWLYGSGYRVFKALLRGFLQLGGRRGHGCAHTLLLQLYLLLCSYMSAQRMNMRKVEDGGNDSALNILDFPFTIVSVMISHSQARHATKDP